MSNPPIQSIKLKPRINALAQYLLALSAVIGTYSLYAKHAVPLLEGPPNVAKKVPVVALEDLPPASDTKSELIPYLPEDAWELSNCKTLLTASGTILFKEFLEQPDGTIQVTPFTLFLGLDNKSSQAKQVKSKPDKQKHPTVLRCVEGASLQFDQPMNKLFGGKAKLESARLVGNVDIYRPPSSAQANDALQVLTSNVQLNKDRIFTLDNVQFAFGSNSGTGRNLVIELSHEASPLGADFSNVNGIRRLELAFLHRLRFEPPQRETPLSRSPNSKSQKALTSDGKLFSNNRSPIDVSCQGPFVFDFETNTASFEDQVVASQIDAFRDTIKCDKLSLEFQEKKIEDVPQAQPGKGMVDLQLKTFLAQGSPATVISRSSSTQVTGEVLKYDIPTNHITGQCHPANQLLVTLVSPEYQLVTKELEYSLTEDDSLGPITASGPGRLLKVASKDQKQFFASWQTSLTSKDVAGQTGLQRIVLDGQTEIRIGTDTTTKADQVEMFVWQLPVTKVDKAGNRKQGWDYQPYKLLAKHQVKIDSPRFEGTADTITAFWSQPGADKNQPTRDPVHQVGYRGALQVKPNRPNNQLRFNPLPSSESELTATTLAQENSSPVFDRPPTKTSLVSLASLPTSNHNASSMLDAGQREQVRTGTVELANFEEKTPLDGKQATPPRKIKFKGEEVVILLGGLGGDTDIRDLTIMGNVLITDSTLEPLQSTPDHQPFIIQGDRLRLVPQGKEMYRVFVSSEDQSSQLASITTKDLKLLGETINLDQKSNKLWATGNGSMKLEKAESNPNNRSTAAAQTSSSELGPKAKGNSPLPDDLNVSWAGGMSFDGKRIYFEHDVLMSVKMPEKSGRSVLKSSSEGLSIALENPVDFRNLSASTPRGETKVRELVFTNSISESKRIFQLAGHAAPTNPTQQPLVVVENRKFDLNGNLAEQQLISVPHVTVDAETGALLAKGPGFISTHRLGGGDSNNPLSKLSTNQNKEGLSFIRVNFDGELNVDSEPKQMLVNGNVRAIFAPVGSWNQTFDPATARQLAPQGSVNLSCQKLQLAQWQPRSAKEPVSEMIASENTHLFSETFESTGDRVSFNQGTDMLTIEGTSRTDANLWFKQTPNDNNPTHLIAEKIKFRITDQWTQVQGVKNLNSSRK